MNEMTTPAGGVDTPAQSRQPLVVGFDGSAASRTAVEWAATEAARSHAPLKIVMVVEENETRVPPYTSPLEPVNLIDHAYGLLDAQVRQLDRSHRDVEVLTDVVVEDSRKGLLRAARQASLVVVGARGIGAFKRMMLGSTSIELAGRAPVPVIVVPTGWTPGRPGRDTVLVGVDIRSDSDPQLGFGFEHAAELGLPLVALHVWDTHASIVVTDEERRRWGGEAERAVAASLALWRGKYPQVEARAAERHAHPAEGLLDAAERAELLVLGRHSRGRSPLGLGIGSVSRTVLHYATLPVAIVPTAM